MKEALVIRDIENTANTLKKLVDYLKHENEEKGDELNKIIMLNHPLISKLKEILKINYNFYIDGKQDLFYLLSSFGFKKTDTEWIRSYPSGVLHLSISDELFENDKLKYLKPNEWKDSYVEVNYIENKPPDEDLPF